MPLPEGGNLGGLGSIQAPLNFASKLFLPQQVAHNQQDSRHWITRNSLNAIRGSLRWKPASAAI